METGRDADGKRQAWLAHRLVWHLLGGELPEDLHHDGCPLKSCVRPACLSPLTKAEHTVEHHPLAEECSNGHPYDEANTYWRKGRNGGRSRQCRRCKADREAARMKALPEDERRRLRREEARRRRAT